jgi:mRNA-degrading endonuclease RelE of RelBE toxin-antitoxin system
LFQVITSQKARKSIKKLPEHYKRRIIELLLIFRENPVPAEYYDIKKLKGYTDTYRARIGDVRVIYEILWDLKKVHVLLVERRERAYP